VLAQPEMSCRACGPRNLMKMVQSKMITARSSEVGLSLEKSRPLKCLIRSVRY